jgi:hypothetical protein
MLTVRWWGSGELMIKLASLANLLHSLTASQTSLCFSVAA